MIIGFHMEDYTVTDGYFLVTIPLFWYIILITPGSTNYPYSLVTISAVVSPISLFGYPVTVGHHASIIAGTGSKLYHQPMDCCLSFGSLVDQPTSSAEATMPARLGSKEKLPGSKPWAEVAMTSRGENRLRMLRIVDLFVLI